VSWGYLCLALLLFVAGGLLIGFAVYDGGAVAWAMAILVPMLGVLVMAARMLRESRPRKVKPESSVEWREAAAPPLGQMLVNYGLMTEADLTKALERQKGDKKRLGKVLVEMGLVTHAQVAEVLEEQVSRREGRLRWGAREALVD
jgi:hypothetical protein